jgi:hypothetical protein
VLAQHAREEIDACYRFKVEFDSTIHEDFQQNDPAQTSSGAYDYHYTATVSLTPQGNATDQLTLSGQGPGTLDASGTETLNRFCGTGPNGDLTETRTIAITGADGGTVTIPRFVLPVTPNSDPSMLLVFKTDESETYHADDSGDCGSDSFDLTDSGWFGNAQAGHTTIGEGTGGELDLELNPDRTPSPGLGSLVVERDYSISTPLAGGAQMLTEDTSVRVLHTPHAEASSARG